MQDSNPVSVVSKAGYFSHPQGSSSEVSQGVLQLVPVFRQAVLEKSNFTEDLSWGGGGASVLKIIDHSVPSIRNSPGAS